MDLTIRIYTKRNGFSDTRKVHLTEGELDEMLAEYLKREEYVKEDEEIEIITYDSVYM